MIYQIAKDILCGKRFDGLVDSIQSQTRVSFNHFVSNIFKYLVNDYGLETLPKLSVHVNEYGQLLNLIDYSVFSMENEMDFVGLSMMSGNVQVMTHYACIPQTPLFHLFHQQIKSRADAVKIKLLDKQTQINSNHHNKPFFALLSINRIFRL